MRVYLAGPMRGHDDLNSPTFAHWAALLREFGHEVFNPAEQNDSGSGIRQCMEIDTAFICRYADAVALIPGWDKSLGARAEYALAKAIGIPIFPLEKWYSYGGIRELQTLDKRDAGVKDQPMDCD